MSNVHTNDNYVATVVAIPNLRPLEGCDNLVGASVFGFQAIVDKSYKTGDLAVVFPSECQLSHDMCRENDLYRDANANKTMGKKGYLEEKRRVRAIKLRGHRSDCLMLPVESLAWTGYNLKLLSPGQSFGNLNGRELCRKYMPPTVVGVKREKAARKPKVNRVIDNLFPKHPDTANYFRYAHRIPPEAHIVVTQKLHGTSWRGSRAHVRRPLNWRERFARLCGVRVEEHEWAAIAGTRNTVKDPHKADLSFYRTDLWTDRLNNIESVLPESFVFYGELIGWTGQKPIQKNYTYHMPPGYNELYIYRIAMVNPRGLSVDLAWPQVEYWCRELGLKTVPLLWSGLHRDFNPDAWLDMRFAEEFKNAVPLSGNNTVDEGVCVRHDNGLTPLILKAKSPIFRQHETKILDAGEGNMEDEEMAQ